MIDFFTKTFFAGRNPAQNSQVVNSVAEQDENRMAKGSGGSVKILKKGPAMRVIFFYPGEEGTYVDNAEVVLYDNGIVHITSNQDETTTHLQNCEILWRFETDAEERTNKVRLLKPKTDSRPSEETTSKTENKPGKGN